MPTARERSERSFLVANESEADAPALAFAPSLAVVIVDGHPAGLAFLVGPDRALTLAHVVARAGKLQLDFAWAEGKPSVGANVEVIDRDDDYALLRLAQPMTIAPLGLGALAPGGSTAELALLDLTDETSRELRLQVATTYETRLDAPPAGVGQIQAKRLLLVDLGLDPDGPRISPGNSGTPAVVNGLVVAIAGYSNLDGSRPCALPVSVPLSDHRVRQALGLPDGPPPRWWVAVAGGRSRPANELASSIGDHLAVLGAGLITGGFPGVDEAVARTFLDCSLLYAQHPEALRVVQARQRVHPFFERGIQVFVRGRKSWVDETLELASLLVVLDGSDSVELLAEAALRHGIPVLVLPTGGEQTEALYRRLLEKWESAPLPGIDRAQYAGLLSLRSEQKAAFISRVLQALPQRQTGPSAAPPEQAADLVPGYGEQAFPTLGNDAAYGKDLLNLDRQAEIFARAIVARSLKPPLAIGLFGDWGAGKSYFMHLIREAAKKISQGADDCWPHVCHIEFNAWHYMDADLWAGLAGQIFDKLAEQLAEQSGTKTADRTEMRRKLRERLRSTQDAKDEAEANVRFAVDRLSELRVTIEQLQAERDAKFQGANALMEPDFWKALAGRISPGDAKTAAKKLGLVRSDQDIDAILKAPEQVRALADELNTAQGQTRAFLRTLSPANIGVWMLGGLITFGPILLQVLQSADVIGKLNLSAASTAVAQVAALVTTVTVQLRLQLTRTSKFIEYANEVRNKGDLLKKQALAKLTTEQQAAVRAYEQVQAKLDTAVTRKNDLEREISETQTQLDALKAGRLVYDFVLSRSGDQGAYRSREGIVSIVRRDLETLSDLLRQWREDEPERPEQIAFTELPAKDQEQFPIQRIVLYIDDLDRCPPDRVVEVLQAVHLLLAFDLFVVVVGVDARWLERSLEQGYRSMLSIPGAKTGLRARAASPQEYLEKIFQVPFTLPSVQPTGFRDLIENELRLLSELEAVPPPLESRSLGSVAQPSKAPTHSSVDAARAAAAGVAASGASATSTATVGAAANSQNGSGSKTVVVSGAPPASAAPATKVAQHFHLEPWEREFMTKRLAPFISTPRLIRRFANIYRLLRADAADEHFHRFVRNHSDADHRAVQVMLAANVGFPRFGSDLMRLLATPANNGAALPATWGALLDQLDPEAAVFSTFAPQFPNHRTDSSGLKRLHGILCGLRDEVPAPLQVWSDWSHRVGRYSMYWRSP